MHPNGLNIRKEFENETHKSFFNLLAFCSPFVILRDTCRVMVGYSHIYITLPTLSCFDFVHSLWYIQFLHSHITFFILFHLFWWFVCQFLVFPLFCVRQFVFYFGGISQTLTPPFCCTFTQVGFHLKPPHLYILMVSVYSLFTACTFSLIFTHFYSTHYTIHLIIHFYVRWPLLHPHLVLVISFSYYQVVCGSAITRSTYPV